MATITSRIRGWWSWRQAHPGTTHFRSNTDEGCIEIDDPDSVILGCGWFDSSHDLRTGLAVIDGDAAELIVAVDCLVNACHSTS